MAKTDTRALLGESFIELAKSMPFDKISVSDIVAASGKNRKTFYYHFEDKAQLTRWIFRNDLAEKLTARFSPEQLVFEPDGPGAFPEAPYYVMVKTGVRSLDGSMFFKTLAETFEGRRSFYRQALTAKDSAGLRKYLLQLYTPALEHDIRFILASRPLDAASVHFLAEFYTDACFGYMVNRIWLDGERPLLEGTETFENLVHSSLEHVILEQQLSRGL